MIFLVRPCIFVHCWMIPVLASLVNSYIDYIFYELFPVGQRVNTAYSKKAMAARKVWKKVSYTGTTRTSTTKTSSMEFCLKAFTQIKPWWLSVVARLAKLSQKLFCRQRNRFICSPTGQMNARRWDNHITVPRIILSWSVYHFLG